MGASLKTIQQLMTLTEQGHLPYGSEICDIGTTQLFGHAAKEAARSMLDYYATKAPPGADITSVTDSQLEKIADGGFLGELLTFAGFRYVALDIFDAPRTILFDLNRHAPGPNLRGRFDMVLNFGTTEHVFNQFAAFQTIHDLAKPGGTIYHDLPMAGFFDHAFFRYDPLFFRSLIAANDYTLVAQQFSTGYPKPSTSEMRKNGLTVESFHDVGIEVIIRKMQDTPFRVPLEQSTSLSTKPLPDNMVDNENVVLARESGDAVLYPTSITSEVRLRNTARQFARRVLRAKSALQRWIRRTTSLVSWPTANS